jgi:protein required for attachment to host cells
MGMRKVWVIVANSSLAKFFTAENADKLKEIKSLEHFESHLQNQELSSDHQGLSIPATGFGPHPFQSRTSPKVKEKNHFAAIVAEYLEKEFNQGSFERLYLIANAPFMGHLRAALSEKILKLIQLEIPKDLTLMEPQKIRDYLPPVL